MPAPYVELHSHSNYSFQEGASSIGELLAQAKSLGYGAMALTDHDNLCGAMEFARTANSLDIKPITGAEITLRDGSHLTLIAETRKGYANLCNLITHSLVDGENLDPKFLHHYAEGLVLLTGCSRGRVPRLLSDDRECDAQEQTRRYMEWFGADNVFIELQRNLVHGETARNRRLFRLARKLGVRTVPTNNVHYHVPERHRLQDVLVAIGHNKALEETHRERRPNANFYLKSPEQMTALFQDIPEAVQSSAHIAERCTFNLKEDLGYKFPDYPAPEGYTPQTYLEKICYEAAVRRYGSVTARVQERLSEEFRLISKHNLAGFFLIYHEIINMAQEVMIDLGLSDREIPLEERPPGRGRGSSVVMLVGYLVGLSHIDPLKFDLSLERFIYDEMGDVPDIDLDLPRAIREELIKRVHVRWGWDHAALTGMISTYGTKGCIRGLGKAFGLPYEDVDKLAKRVDTRHAKNLRSEMMALPDFRDKVDTSPWQELLELAPQMAGFPKYLAQHPGGMVISSSPLTEMVPVQPSAIDGRYICHWDKDSIDDAGFVKIDFLALGALSQMQETLQIIERRTGRYIDLSRINFEDRSVYGSLHRADTIGIFQVESAAQMQTLTRIKPQNLTEMAYEVAAVRPGVGVNNGVSLFIDRHANKAPWGFDHPLEERALGRTLGIILFQDQVNQLAIDVAGLSPKEADDLRRVFSRRNNRDLVNMYREKFSRGASELGVPRPIAEKIFRKFSGQYMFPESHAYAFGITAYQMAWLKHHYPLEFFVAIFNQQPMGFYNLETLKEDAKRHGINVLNPDINESEVKCKAKDDAVLLGLMNVSGIGASRAKVIVEARVRDERSFSSLSDVIYRTGLQREALENLVMAGTFDTLIPDRRAALWQVGLLYRPIGVQQALPIPVGHDMIALPALSDWEVMLGEYRTMGLYPRGHFMAHMRPCLDPKVLPSKEAIHLEDGTEVTVAGLVIRRQHPGTSAVFITLEDEFGHVSLLVWPQVFQRYRLAIRAPILKVRGFVSRRQGTMNVVAQQIEGLPTTHVLPYAKNWG